MLPPKELYAKLVYSLEKDHPSIERLSLAFYTISSFEGRLKGEIVFRGDIVLRVSETIDFEAGVIQQYSYAVYRGDEKLYWYDPQPHPDDPSLASTFPHHKHIPPNIKHNRVPAPGISFDEPNLPFLIEEIEQTLLK